MSTFPYSSAVTAGNPATAAEYNNGRKDGMTRWLKFEILGNVAVGDSQGGSFIMPFAGSVVKITSQLDAGSATIVIEKESGETTINSESVTTTVNEDTTISAPTFSKNDVIAMDVTAVSGASHLVVMVEVLATP